MEETAKRWKEICDSGHSYWSAIIEVNKVVAPTTIAQAEARGYRRVRTEPLSAEEKKCILDTISGMKEPPQQATELAAALKQKGLLAGRADQMICDFLHSIVRKQANAAMPQVNIEHVVDDEALQNLHTDLERAEQDAADNEQPQNSQSEHDGAQNRGTTKKTKKRQINVTFLPPVEDLTATPPPQSQRSGAASSGTRSRPRTPPPLVTEVPVTPDTKSPPRMKQRLDEPLVKRRSRSQVTDDTSPLHEFRPVPPDNGFAPVMLIDEVPHPQRLPLTPDQIQEALREAHVGATVDVYFTDEDNDVVRLWRGRLDRYGSKSSRLSFFFEWEQTDGINWNWAKLDPAREADLPNQPPGTSVFWEVMVIWEGPRLLSQS